MTNLARSQESNSLATREAKQGDLTTRLSSLLGSHILDAGADLITRRFIRNRKDAIELGSKGVSLALVVAGGLLAPEFVGVGLTGKIALSLAGSLVAHIGKRWKEDIELAEREAALASTIRKFERTDCIDAIAYAQAEALRQKLPHRRPSPESQQQEIATIAQTLDGLIEYVEGLGNPQLLSAAESAPARFDWSELRNPDKHPHLLILSETGGGKTWLGEWVADWIGQGHDLKVISTKRKRDQWRGMPVVGIGRDFAAIEAEFQSLLTTMTQRCKNLDDVEGLPHIIRPIDELPAIAENIEGDKDSRGKYKGLSTYTKPLILEARETRIRLILHAQGKQVRLLGFEGISDCLDNLTIIRLGKMAVDHAKALFKNGVITEQDFQWLQNQSRPVTVNDTLAEYPRSENWQPTGNYISVNNSANHDSLHNIFGQFTDSSGGGGAEDSDGNPEDSDGNPEDSDPEAEDSRKTHGKGAEDDLARFEALLDNPPDEPLFDTLDRNGRLFMLRVMLFRNLGIQETIRLAWGHKPGGRNYAKYQAAREMLDRMIEELNKQGFNADNYWGF